MKRLLVLMILLPSLVFAQKSLLQNGPMLGYLTMHEVMFWVQTTQKAKVKVAYYPVDNPKLVKWTNTVETSADEAFTAHLVGNSLIPATKYHYDVYINDKKVDLGFPTEFKTKAIWKYRTQPPDFSFATGSGSYINDPKWDRPGKPYGGGYEIYRSIYKKHPDFMIWLGDNVYLRQNEWNSWTGIVYRYTHDRHIPEMEPLLANVFNYAIWDDHDFGPNDSDGSFPFKSLTFKAFKAFWANPSYGLPGIPGAITYFNWNDVDFFLLDNRTYRDPDHMKTDGYKTELGRAQLEWLKRALVFSKANFKIVAMGGQFLNPAAVFETYSNYGFDKERRELIDWIYEQNIRNVIFLTGDRHSTELDVLKVKGRPTIYDLTVSPFNSHPATATQKEVNVLRVPGTLVATKRNFAIVKFTGPSKTRKMVISIYDKDGNLLWTREIQRETDNPKGEED